jgi:hypothetical protein
MDRVRYRPLTCSLPSPLAKCRLGGLAGVRDLALDDEASAVCDGMTPGCEPSSAVEPPPNLILDHRGYRACLGSRELAWPNAGGMSEKGR